MTSDISVDTRVIGLIATNLKPVGQNLATSNRHRTADQATLPPPVDASYDAVRRALYSDGVAVESMIAKLATAVHRTAELMEYVELTNSKGSLSPP